MYKFLILCAHEPAKLRALSVKVLAKNTILSPCVNMIVLVKKDAPLESQDVGTDHSIQICCGWSRIILIVRCRIVGKRTYKHSSLVSSSAFLRVMMQPLIGVAHMHQRPEGRGGFQMFTLDNGAWWVKDALSNDTYYPLNLKNVLHDLTDQGEGLHLQGGNTNWQLNL